MVFSELYACLFFYSSLVDLKMKMIWCAIMNYFNLWIVNTSFQLFVKAGTENLSANALPFFSSSEKANNLNSTIRCNAPGECFP